MHPRIKDLFSQIKEISPEKVLNIEVLHLLKDYGATRTEASITIHQGFNLDLEKVDDFVIKSNIWTNEAIGDVFYETLKYLYYNPDDPNYESDDNRTQISI
jgi:hypothetical protein